MSYFDASIPWAIQPEHLIRLDALAAEHMKASAGNLQAAAQHAPRAHASAPAVHDGVAVIELTGPLTKGFSWVTAIMGGTSMQQAGAQIELAAADPAVKGIMLYIDSPGGTVDGTETLARVIREAGASKPVVALAGGTIASAAYWVGSAASAVYLESGTTMAGSIGVVSKHVDISALEARVGIKTTEITSGKFKRIASMHEPLSDAGRSSIQAQLDHVYGLFVHAVAEHRGATVQAVLDRMADGRVFIGHQAIDAGLADGFATPALVMASLRAGRTPKPTPKPERKAMTNHEIKQTAVAEVGPNGTPEQYQAAMDRLMASNPAASTPEPRCQVTGLTLEEKVEKAQAYAQEHGTDLVAALKALGYAK